MSTTTAIICMTLVGVLTLIGAILAVGTGGGVSMTIGGVGLALLVFGFSGFGDAARRNRYERIVQDITRQKSAPTATPATHQYSQRSSDSDTPGLPPASSAPPTP